MFTQHTTEMLNFIFERYHPQNSKCFGKYLVSKCEETSIKQLLTFIFQHLYTERLTLTDSVLLLFLSTFCGLILASKNSIQRMAFLPPTHIHFLAGYKEFSGPHKAALCYVRTEANKI